MYHSNCLCVVFELWLIGVVCRLLLWMMRYVSFKIEMYGSCLFGLYVCGCCVGGVHSLLCVVCCCMGVSTNRVCGLCGSCVSCMCGWECVSWWCPSIVGDGGCGLGVCRSGVRGGSGVLVF